MSLRSKQGRLFAVAGALAASLALAAGARPGAVAPVLALGQVVVANGTATLAGSVGGAGAGAVLTANGHPLGLDASGHFAGVVDLNGASTLDLAVANPVTGQQVSFQIPLTTGLLGPGGIIPAGVLDAVEQAGAALLAPAGGFPLLDGKPLQVDGTVADPSQLAGLSVNGVDALHLVQPDQTFSVQLPGTTREVKLTSTDASGVSETQSYGVSNLYRTSQGISVGAANAIGVRIAGVRYVTKGVARTKRLRMIVTIKDSRGYLVNGASVKIRSKAAGRLTRRSQLKRSGIRGQAAFVLKVRPRSLGKRLVMVTVARTPTAKASKTTSVRLRKSRKTARHQ